MPATTIRSPPALTDYTTLSEHQESTPETFFGGKPVLYYHATGAKAWLSKSQRGCLPFFPQDFEADPTGPEGGALNGTAEENVEQIVDLFVSSQSLTLFCPTAESGISIPYQAVTLHAVKNIGSGESKHPSVYLQLDLSAGGGEDDESFDTVELTLIPPPTPATEASADGASPSSETTKLFGAISECSNLNPDPAGEDEDDDDDRIIFEADHQAIEGYSGVFVGSGTGGLPPPLPGSSGWITAENVHEYFDEDGNWIGEEEGVSGELGDGAGTVHGRDEDEDDANADETNGDGESKRPRTES
ncbi:hypothetical protein GQ53DRAFT_742561 [Thozetella sp. PMI_491]|nr:hypothetical protein GQ53DRAFT_742561 [Thozetella sp. PMI_491]